MRRNAIAYAEALEWLALNDDNDWLNEERVHAPSVTFAAIADIYRRPMEEAEADLRRTIERLG